MPQSIVQPSDAITQQVWRSGITHEVERNVVGMSFLGTSSDSPFMLLDDLSKSRGDTVQTKFSPTEDFDGISDQEEVAANGRRVTWLTDSLNINYLGAPFGGPGIVSQQRTNFDIKQATFVKAAAWWRRRFETCIWNQMAGYTPANTDGNVTYEYTGLNAVTAQDSNHIYRPNGITADQSLGTSDKLTLDDITEVVTMAETSTSYPIAPADDGYYHLVIHPLQARDLRLSTLSGEWEDIQLARLKGGQDFASSHLSTGLIGIYNNVMIHRSNFIPLGVNGSDSTASVSNTRRAVFFGAQAACMAFGEDYASDGHLNWSEEVHDHNKWSLLVDSVFGFKRTIYNSESYGTITLATYAA